jgi:predicted RecB family nuclease
MVKGIRPKRAEQLERSGIGTTEDLTKASAKMLSAKIEISQKVTCGWIKEEDKLIKLASQPICF